MASKPPLPSPAVAGPSIARRQPLRQARTARKPATSKLTTNGTEPSAHHLPPAKFYPALTAFTDAVDALPSEIIRHFTLLREVDAKACLPEANLRALIDAAERLPAASDPYEFDAAMESLKQLDELRRRRDADPLFATNQAQVEILAGMEKSEAAEASNTGGAAAHTILGASETRRARCHQIRGQIADLLVTQDEKIHVITTAVEALQKHLARVEHAFAYVEVEIPEIYRLGNREHWAYKEPMKKGTAAQIAREKERERREQEERLHQMQMESNVRGGGGGGGGGGGRGNNTKNSHHHYAHHQHQEEQEPVKKRVRKTGDNETLSSTKRIADQQAGAQQQQQAKKRKTAATKEEREKAAAAKGTASPRASTPVPKKVKNAAQRAPRSRTAQTPTASATNSPLLGPPNIPLPHIQPLTATLNVASPLNPATPFTAAAPTSAPAVAPPQPPPPPPLQASKSHAKKEPTKPAVETDDTEMLPAPVQEPPPPPPPAKVSHKKKQRAPSPISEATVEEQVPKKNTPTLPPKKDKEKEDHHHPPAINTKAKPSNSSGGEPKSAASTTGTPGGSRNRKRADSNATSVSIPAAASEPAKKKSHKARSQQKPGTAPIGLGISTTTTSGTKKDKEQEESGDEDGSEERYCYCNGVSYGEMVACDGDDCEKEWFHLECAGLTQAPKGKVKWYCRDCEAIRGRGRSRA